MVTAGRAVIAFHQATKLQPFSMAATAPLYCSVVVLCGTQWFGCCAVCGSVLRRSVSQSVGSMYAFRPCQGTSVEWILQHEFCGDALRDSRSCGTATVPLHAVCTSPWQDLAVHCMLGVAWRLLRSRPEYTLVMCRLLCFCCCVSHAHQVEPFIIDVQFESRQCSGCLHTTVESL